MTESKFRTFSELFSTIKTRKNPTTHLAELQAPGLF